jgi:hypothetical protein
MVMFLVNLLIGNLDEVIKYLLFGAVGWALTKLYRSGYISRCGLWGRVAAIVTGELLFLAALDHVTNFPWWFWIPLSLVVGVITAALSRHWLLDAVEKEWDQGAEMREYEASERKRKTERAYNSVFKSKCPAIVKEREEIRKRAMCGYDCPEQRKADVRRLGSLLGDQGLGETYVELMEEKGWSGEQYKPLPCQESEV